MEKYQKNQRKYNINEKHIYGVNLANNLFYNLIIISSYHNDKYLYQRTSHIFSQILHGVPIGSIYT